MKTLGESKALCVTSGKNCSGAMSPKTLNTMKIAKNFFSVLERASALKLCFICLP